MKLLMPALGVHNSGPEGAGPDWSTIPQLVLWCIVQHLDDSSDIAALRLTCRRWSKTVTQNSQEWRVRGPVARFHWDYLRGTLYTLCPVVDRLTVALSNRVTGDALGAMFADLNWWSRLREVVLVAIRPPGSGLFGPGLSSEALTGLSSLRGLKALTTEGCDALMALHGALCCPQLTKLVVRGRRSPLGSACRVSNRFLELLTESQLAISSGQPLPRRPWRRRRNQPGAGEADGGGGGGGEGPGGGGGGGDEDGPESGSLPDLQQQIQNLNPGLDLRELQDLFREEGDGEGGGSGGDGSGAAAAAADGEGDVVMADASASTGAGRWGRTAAAAAVAGGGDAVQPRGGLRHLELDSDAHLDDASSVMALLDAGGASSSLSLERLQALLAALPSLQHLDLRRVPLPEPLLRNQVAALTALTELRMAVQDGRTRPVRAQQPGSSDGPPQAIDVLTALAQICGSTAAPPSLWHQHQQWQRPHHYHPHAQSSAGPSGSDSGAGGGAADAAAADWNEPSYGPPPGPGRPTLHLYVNGVTSSTPAVLLSAMVPLVPRLKTLVMSHRAFTSAHLLSVGQLTSLDYLALTLAAPSSDSAAADGGGAAAAAHPAATAAAARRRTRMQAATAMQREAMLMAAAMRVPPRRCRQQRAGIFGAFLSRAAAAGRPPPHPDDFYPDSDEYDDDVDAQMYDSDAADGGPGGEGYGIGLEALQRLTQLRELHLKGPQRPVGHAARVAAGLAALATNEPALAPPAGPHRVLPPRQLPGGANGGAAGARDGPRGGLAAAVRWPGRAAWAQPPPRAAPPPPSPPQPQQAQPRTAVAAREDSDDDQQPSCFPMPRRRQQRGSTAAAQQPRPASAAAAAQDAASPPSGAAMKTPSKTPPPPSRSASASAAAANSSPTPSGAAGPFVSHSAGASAAASGPPGVTAASPQHTSAAITNGRAVGGGSHQGPKALADAAMNQVQGSGATAAAAPPPPPMGVGAADAAPSAPLPLPGHSDSLPLACASAPFLPIGGGAGGGAAGSADESTPTRGSQASPPPPPYGTAAAMASSPSQSASPEMQALAAALALAAAEWDGPDGDGGGGGAVEGPGEAGLWPMPMGLLPPPGMDVALEMLMGEEGLDDPFFLAHWGGGRGGGGGGGRGGGRFGAGRGAGRHGRGGGRFGAGGGAGYPDGPPMAQQLMAQLAHNPLLARHQELLLRHQQLLQQEQQQLQQQAQQLDQQQQEQQEELRLVEAQQAEVAEQLQRLEEELMRGHQEQQQQQQEQQQQGQGQEMETTLQQEQQQKGRQQPPQQPQQGEQRHPHLAGTSQQGPSGGRAGGGGGGGSGGSGSLGGGGAARGRGRDERTSRGGGGGGPQGPGGSGGRVRSRGWLSSWQNMFGALLGHDGGAAAGAADDGGAARRSEASGGEKSTPMQMEVEMEALSSSRPHDASNSNGKAAGGAGQAESHDKMDLDLESGRTDMDVDRDEQHHVRAAAQGQGGGEEQRPPAAAGGAAAAPGGGGSGSGAAGGAQPAAAAAPPPAQQPPPPPAQLLLQDAGGGGGGGQVPYAAQALEDLARDRQMLRRAVLGLQRTDLVALATHGSVLEALTLHYFRMPPSVVTQLTAALPRLRRLSLLWANDQEQPPRAEPCRCCGAAAAGGGRPCSAAAAGGGGGGGGTLEVSELPPLLEKLELGGPVTLVVTAADLGGPCGSNQAPGPVWTQLRRLVLKSGIGLPHGALPRLLERTPHLTELQLLRPRGLQPHDLAALEGLDRLRCLVVDPEAGDLECREVRRAMARGISRLAGLTALQELRWNVPDPLSLKRRGLEEKLAVGRNDHNLELCHQLYHLTGLQRLSLLSLPSCRHLLAGLDDLQALRHLPFLELTS
ncbi:hypothetical protein PLESTB_001055500 [Pleodorina starrii]|uniref:F-box domain-containing protein n=1 Tax=Pleodorina starrii TaxID=330485 RepID=A0A9W6BQH4_9CHLO|nr:hypothetical protein PLESTB_001055500 [Pleodorina starrii]